MLLRLLRFAGDGGLGERDLFDRQLRVAEEHLARRRAKYFLLEIGEVLEDETALRVLVDNEIPEAARLAEAVLAGGDRRQLRRLRSNWRDHFDSFYSDYLYYTPPGS